MLYAGVTLASGCFRQVKAGSGGEGGADGSSRRGGGCAERRGLGRSGSVLGRGGDGRWAGDALPGGCLPGPEARHLALQARHLRVQAAHDAAHARHRRHQLRRARVDGARGEVQVGEVKVGLDGLAPGTEDAIGVALAHHVEDHDLLLVVVVVVVVALQHRLERVGHGAQHERHLAHRRALPEVHDHAREGGLDHRPQRAVAPQQRARRTVEAEHVVDQGVQRLGGHAGGEDGLEGGRRRPHAELPPRERLPAA
eukprot:7380556-Prymnesium_polylepis.1